MYLLSGAAECRWESRDTFKHGTKFWGVVIGSSESAGSSKSSLININTADEKQLDALPGIGPTLAARIVEYRQANGPFKSIEEVKNVSGIGEKRFADIKDLITVR